MPKLNSTISNVRAEKTAWHNAIKRCHDPNNKYFCRYGGRGIFVCDEWRKDFDRFFKDSGPRPSNQHSLDRIDNNDGYRPGNCRWATSTVQANNRRNSTHVTIGGVTRTVSEWARIAGISHDAFRDRVMRGTVGQFLLLPISTYSYRPKPLRKEVRACSVCDKPHRASGLCVTHYGELWRASRRGK